MLKGMGVGPLLGFTSRTCHFAFLELDDLKVCWTRVKLGGRYATGLRCGANFCCSKFYRQGTCYP